MFIVYKDLKYVSDAGRTYEENIISTLLIKIFVVFGSKNILFFLLIDNILVLGKLIIKHRNVLS